MAKKKGKDEEKIFDDLDDFTDDLIKGINESHKDKIAFNLGTDESPTAVSRFINSGSKQLNYILSRQLNGGFPEGRIIEIYGPPAIGKSHLAIQLARSAQEAGGIACYADTENATSIDNLVNLGINLKRLIYIQPSCTEEVFQAAEEVIKRARASNKDVPIVFIWDSVAGSSPKDEIDGNYDKMTIGLQARALSKGFRKITQTIGHNKITFCVLNQIRTRIGVMFGNPMTTPGGHALPFHASVRLELSSGAHIKDKNDNVIGINVKAKTIKNKIVAPHRFCEFQIIFGVGLNEDEQIFSVIEKEGKQEIDGKIYQLKNAGGWKKFIVNGEDKESFRKDEWPSIYREYQKIFDEMFENAMAKKFQVSINNPSFEEIKEIHKQQEE